VKLSDEMHNAVVNSEVGQFLDRLIREEVLRSGPIPNVWHGSIVQALWDAFMQGTEGTSDR